MPTHRRLTAVLAAVSLGWALLAVGVAAPAAQAAAPVSAAHDPATYYAGTEGLVGADLANKLTSIIKGHTTVSYATVYTALDVTDRDPANSAAIIDFYSGTSVLASNKCQASCPSGSWNREHTWPQSHGDFGTGQGPGTDLHHMRPEFATTNSSRGNLDFDNGGSTGVPLCALCKRDSDSFEPRDAVKGDLARGLFYMAVRYDGTGGFPDFKMNDRTCNGSGPANLGKLSTLVAWSLADPPDDRERARNDLVDDSYQHNRNPFIDHPEWVTTIYGDGVGLGPACGSTSGSDTLPGGGTSTNRPPTASPTTGSTAQDTATTLPLSATDPDGDPLTWTVTAAPSHGTVSVSGATLTYTPATGYSGSDQVGVTVSDGRGGAVSTTVSITVTPRPQGPTATPVSASTAEDQGVTFALAGSAPGGSQVTYSIASHPAHGSLVLTGDRATYTPAANYHGSDAFTYTVFDGTTTSAPATASITVAPVNDAPVATPRRATTAEDTTTTITVDGTDVDGDVLTHTIAAQPAHGSVTLSGTQATYTPAADFHGTDTFTWTVSDGTATTTGTATVEVTPVNDAPSVSAPSPLHTTAGTPVSVTLDATDRDGDVVTISKVSAPEHGSVTYTGLTVTYTPSTRSGTEAFTATVTDGNGAEATARVGVEIDARAALLKVATPEATRGTRVTTTITATGPAGPSPSGTVTLTNGGTVVGTARLGSGGTATVAWTPGRAGTTSLVASYDGDELFAPVTSQPASVKVARSAARLGFTAGTLRRGRAGVVKVSVRTVAGLAATGKVTVTAGSKKLTATLAKGVATFRIAKLPRTATLKVSARYAGDTQYAARTATHTYRLKK